MARAKLSEGSVELFRVCTVLPEVYQGILSGSTAVDKAHSEGHCVQVGPSVLRGL